MPSPACACGCGEPATPKRSARILYECLAVLQEATAEILPDHEPPREEALESTLHELKSKHLPNYGKGW